MFRAMFSPIIRSISL